MNAIYMLRKGFGTDIGVIDSVSAPWTALPSLCSAATAQRVKEPLGKLEMLI